MVLSDITEDYGKLITILDKHSASETFIQPSLSLISAYHAEINELAGAYLKSAKSESNRSDLISGLNSIEGGFSTEIANICTALRQTTLLVQEIESEKFHSRYGKDISGKLCSILNSIMEIAEQYIFNKIKNKSNKTVFFDLTAGLDMLKNIYDDLISGHALLSDVEDSLLEDLPANLPADKEISYLDIRSVKADVNPASFADDLKLLTECLHNFERLATKDPARNNSIFLRKIESGSLKARFGSVELDFSIFPDLITSISNAIRTWRMIPAEKEQVRAEAEKTRAEAEKVSAEASLLRTQAEEQRIKNEGTKLGIINSQIDFLCEKLALDPSDPACKEQIQQFCLPLIDYIERNPKGSINGIKYDVSREVHLLEGSDEDTAEEDHDEQDP